MAQKTSVKITARKIVTPQQNIVLDTSKGQSAQDIILGLTEYVCLSVPGANGTTDTLILTVGGFQITSPQEFADVAIGLSSTDLTNS